jgi:hypothetical protein
MWHEWRDRRGEYRVLIGKPEGRRPLGRPRCRTEFIFKQIFMNGMRKHGLD